MKTSMAGGWPKAKPHYPADLCGHRGKTLAPFYNFTLIFPCILIKTNRLNFAATGGLAIGNRLKSVSSFEL